MERTCLQCSAPFEITEEDLAFYDKVSPIIAGQKQSIPPPTLCSECRFQRRITFRNERMLYKNACGLCHKPLISIYKPGGMKVYCQDCYWGDKWDPLSHGLPLLLDQPFLEQINPLCVSVPVQSNIIINSINSDYNTYAVNCKNCYLCQRVQAEDCLHSYVIMNCLGCADCSYTYQSQYCYECVDTWNCYKTFFSQFCKNCRDCWLCYDCIGCNNCIGCAGLRQKEYMIFNKKVSPEEFEKFMEKLQNFPQMQTLREQAHTVFQSHPRRALFQEQTENAYGNIIMKSRNVYQGFDIEESEDIRYARGIEYSKDICDSDFIYYGELCYENMSNSHGTSILFTAGAYNAQHLLYCFLCQHNTNNCFGCVGLRGQQYCILNTQYTKKEYEDLVPKIIHRMKADGTWGKFFPPSMSYFGYNETIANEYFPLSRENALSRNYTWSDIDTPSPEAEKRISAAQLPDRIADVPDDITQWAISCEVTRRPFKLVKQELDFYRTMRIPVPHLHPDERHKKRMTLRNPRKIYHRACDKCKKDIKTTYAPDRPEIVYCERCYLETVY